MTRASRRVLAGIPTFVLVGMGTGGAAAQSGEASHDFPVVRISLDGDGAEATSAGHNAAAVSAADRLVAFPGSFPAVSGPQLWLRDRDSGTTERVSAQHLVPDHDALADRALSGQATMSADGRHVAWVGEGIGGIFGDDSCDYCVYRRDLTTSSR